MSDAGRLRQIAGDLTQDLLAYDAIVIEATRCLEELARRAPSSLEVRGAGDIVHDCYNAVEHYFERVATELNGGLPAGRDWHATLLSRMARPVEEVRPAVISGESKEWLDELLRFRHLFRHRYGFELKWEKIRPLLDAIRTHSPRLREELACFAATLIEIAEAL